MKFRHKVVVTAVVFTLSTHNLFYAKHDLQPPLAPARRTMQASAGKLPDISKLQLPQETPVEKGRKTEWAGEVALLLSAAAFGMQLGRNWKVKKQEDISLRAWITAFFVDSAWTTYGLASNLYTVALSNTLALLPRIYGIYQIVKGQSQDFKTSVAGALNEAAAV